MTRRLGFPMMPAVLAAFAAFAALAVVVPVGPLATPLTAAPVPVPVPVPASRAAAAGAPIYMVTDSVGLGAKYAVPAAFPGRPVVVDGTPALFVEMMESKHVAPRIAANPELFAGGIAVIAGGYNYPYWDPARFDRSIDSIISRLREAGVRHVLWVTLREVDPQYISASAWRQVQPYYWYFPAVNAHLRAALARHPDLSLVDWAVAANRHGLTYDAIHLNTTGAAVYAATIAEVVSSLDTRVPAGSITRVRVAGTQGIPKDARFVAMNIAAVNTRTAGFVTAFPCGAPRPFTANLHHDAAATVSGAAIAQVGSNGEVCIFNSADTNLVVDVQGWFDGDDGVASVGPVRAHDSREVGPRRPGLEPLGIRLADVPGMTPNAAAAIVNVTITEPVGAGYATAYPCGGSAPLAANVNYGAGDSVPNMAVVAAGAGGRICVIANQETHLVVDVLGAFARTAPVTMQTPSRLLDTREVGRLAAGATVAVAVTGGAGQPARAAGAFLNVTAVDVAGPGFLTAYPCGGGIPPTATLNTTPAGTIANFALVGPGDGGRVCITTSVDTDLVVDISGWTDGFQAIAPVRMLDTRG